jgi:hypothetical protein
MGRNGPDNSPSSLPVEGMNRDADLVRVQVFADYCQARFAFFCSIFVASIIGLLVTLIATAYV